MSGHSLIQPFLNRNEALLCIATHEEYGSKTARLIFALHGIRERGGQSAVNTKESSCIFCIGQGCGTDFQHPCITGAILEEIVNSF